MESSPAPWIEALRHGHDRLAAIVRPLGADQLSGPSYASEWSIAQVLSHLGSGAEIFGLFLDAGLDGTEPPGREAFGPIWESWNAKAPQDKAADAIKSDGALVARLAAMDAEQLAELRLAMFGMDVDAAMLARMRLGELSVHTWDIAVALDPAATVAADAVDLLIDTLDQLAARAGKADGGALSVRVDTSGPARQFAVRVADKVELTESGDGRADLTLPAEAFVRLVYGRLDPAHTPAVQPAQFDLDPLRKLFPGF
ncbi:MAG TPA: maleylpyruvate isomerase family mycothiol-dependent enzyme [Streptosporangiaceae bacterium]|nr:maleylpyruvate isomerase family mycothiol-dependent enzyme [Streptosporangiaceae bacterium]